MVIGIHSYLNGQRNTIIGFMTFCHVLKRPSHLPSDTRFLINESPSNYQLESLKAYGITASQLELQAVGVRTKVERLWFATPVGHENLGSGKVIRRVAGRLKKYFVPGGPAARPRKIFISRKKAACRRVVDESECKPILEELGFEIMVLEDIAWHEQVRFFRRRSDHGPHGAGLTNMIFAPECAAIWEIVPKAVTPHYLVLARQLGHPFQRIHAEPFGDKLMADMRLAGNPRLSALKSHCVDFEPPLQRYIIPHSATPNEGSAFFSTNDRAGGAAIAAYRQHPGLIERRSRVANVG